MKIPIEWLKEYIDIKKSSKEIAEDFTIIGLLLDKGIESYQNGEYKTDVLDLEHRMDRSDWLSITGCARDLAAFQNISFKPPKIYTQQGKVPETKSVIKIKVECPDLVFRFNTKVFKNIKVKPSPSWLKNRLEAYGIPAINNVVDITNYVMVEYGQPMHAQDLAKMEKREIVIRRAKDNEKVMTLLGEEVSLTKDQFVLTQKGKATVVGGIVGGRATAVDENTTEIVLDAGNYDQNNIRKSSRFLRIQNETVSRYDKYLHPKLAEEAINRAIFLILELAGGDYYENVDWYPKKFEEKIIKLTQNRINLISGMNIEKNTSEKILSDLGYKIISYKEGVWFVEVPYFRTDVEVEDDLISDILRISDYNKIPISFINRSPPKDITPLSYTFKDKMREIMLSLSSHEYITDPLVEYNPSDTSQVKLENSLSPQKNALRSNIKQSLSNVLNLYKKYEAENIFIFEIGNIYNQEKNPKNYNDYKEIAMLCIYFENINLTASQNLNKIKQILSAILSNLGVKKYELTNEGKILINNEFSGNLEINSIELNIDLLSKINLPPTRIMSELKNEVVENLSLVIDRNKNFGTAYNFITNFNPNITAVEVLEEYHGKEIGDEKKTILIKITYKTPGTAEIRQQLFTQLKNKFDISHRE